MTGRDVPGLPFCSTNNAGDFNCRPANNNDLILLRDGTALKSSVTRFADVGAISTTDAKYEEFRIIGTIEEHDSGVDCHGKFPDFLEPLENSGVVPGASLRPGAGTISLRREVYCLQSDEIMDVTIPVTYTAR
ncbi:MAG: hypothetical protein M3179_13370 [Actinomycetota bacterium]|nr:hypothetical protein [Actinomycetota bacterium]